MQRISTTRISACWRGVLGRKFGVVLNTAPIFVDLYFYARPTSSVIPRVNDIFFKTMCTQENKTDEKTYIYTRD
jgi:hypothetical protein